MGEDEVREERHPFQISESMELETEWYKEAEQQTLETLPHFMDVLLNSYVHDYGTIVHAVSACALGAIYAANNSGGCRGGLTGFQMGFVMWDIIKQLMYPFNKCGMKLINYDDMLYPQNDMIFSKTLQPHTWKSIQIEAMRRLKESGATEAEINASPLLRHWKDISKGMIPFGYSVEDEKNAE